MFTGYYHFLKKFSITADEQSGLKDNKSTDTTCYTFIENIQQALDKNLHVVGIFLDHTKVMLQTMIFCFIK